MRAKPRSGKRISHRATPYVIGCPMSFKRCPSLPLIAEGFPQKGEVEVDTFYARKIFLRPFEGLYASLVQFVGRCPTLYYDRLSAYG